MGLFGGGNSSKNTTNNIDNRSLNAAGNTGIAVGGDRNNITVTDYGATNKALDAMRSGNSEALQFAGAFGEAAFNLAGDSMVEAFDHSGSVTDAAFDYSAGATDRALDFTEGVTDSALNAIDASSDRAFSFVGEAFSGALTESRMARENAVGAVLESNKRISEVYFTAGREDNESAFSALKIVAIVVGVVGLGVMLRVS